MEFYTFNGKTAKQPKESKMLPNTKKFLIKLSIIIAILIVIATLICMYVLNDEFRLWADKSILRKEITQDNVAIIELDSENLPYIYAYDRYVVTLEKNNLKAYSSTGRKEIDVDISVAKPIFSSSNRFLAVAESYGKKLYLISYSGILWEKDIEGEISRVNINKNGYVSIAVTRN